ncbi:GntR family transcriptional regulator [Saccharibacillus alkalitolerans]|uniref:GntR family transcriptional regulator n=1 Tax=Saccharibacillus alkalitolerans TaxID=2705290 RepID=A0ABX0FA91_9BACL|nr:GntR family transcriptional regulator [Saccharibacillus alkalitolerans]NGZ76875.1 GntR family transcriptional regulator [Saccharibacillus alkalitolerans]
MLSGTSRLPGENGKDYAYRVIRENIMNLNLKPGQAISEVDLAAALQLSRTPVREVMSRLKEEYLVDVIPQVGTYISKIDAQLIEEAAFMRFTLEKEVLPLACKEVSPESLTEIRQNVERQESLRTRRGEAAAFHALDNEFHRLIFRSCGKEHVWDSITRLSTHYNRMRLLFEMEHHFGEAVEQHKEITEMIATGRTMQTEEQAYRHILAPILHWKESLGHTERYAAYFKSQEVFDIAPSGSSIV